MPPTITIVIPALNEAERLPRLLHALAEQTRRPDAIVVSDAGSCDDTRVIAEAAGALVVDGGKPGRGRNVGAAVADTDLIAFLDADVVPGPEFIAEALVEFEERDLDAATSLVAPLEPSYTYEFVCDATNLYLLVIQRVSPRAPGFCIIVRRELHERIGGFDETVVLAEDHEYIQRAAKLGRFRVLERTRIPVSMRRIEKEGLAQLALKYLYTEMLAMTGTPIRSIPFEYEFGAFQAEEDATPVLDVASVREELGGVAEAIRRVTEPTMSALAKVASAELGPKAFEEILESLPHNDLKQLDTYVRRRLVVFPRRVKRAAQRFSDVLWLREPR